MQCYTQVHTLRNTGAQKVYTAIHTGAHAHTETVSVQCRAHICTQTHPKSTESPIDRHACKCMLQVHAHMCECTHSRAHSTDSQQSMHQADLRGFSHAGVPARTLTAHVGSCAATHLPGHQAPSRSHTHNCSTLTRAHASPHSHGLMQACILLREGTRTHTRKSRDLDLTSTHSN